MRIVALLSWFDEPVEFLQRCIAGAAMAGCTDLVAVDGRYDLFPSRFSFSPGEQHDAIRAACAEHGLGWHVTLPDRPWPSEAAKRTAMFKAADEIAGPDDWHLILDADDHIIEPFDLAKLLPWTRHDVGEVTLAHQYRPDGPSDFDDTMVIRKLFRAGQGIHVVDNHYSWRTADGRWLWHNRAELQEPALNVRALRIQHLTRHRPTARREAAKRYYRDRDAAGVEPLFAS